MCKGYFNADDDIKRLNKYLVACVYISLQGVEISIGTYN